MRDALGLDVDAVMGITYLLGRLGIKACQRSHMVIPVSVAIPVSTKIGYGLRWLDAATYLTTRYEYPPEPEAEWGDDDDEDVKA